MQYRLLDASTLLLIFGEESLKEKSFDLLKEITSGDKFFYIPQFCILEVLNTISKWYYREVNGQRKITLEQAKQSINIFSEMIRNKEYLYTYEFNQNHILNSNKIFPVEHTTPKGNKSYLSTFDIAIIAMGAELQFVHGKENFSIISSDKRLVDVSNAASINAVLY